MSQVFISYSHKDSKFAEFLKTKIEEANFDVWMFPKLRAGLVWREEIDEEIRKSFALIVIMTPAAKESEYVTYEWAFAYGVGVRVIPLLLKLGPKEVHPRLEALQCRDFRKNQPWDELLKDLQDAQSSQLTIHYAVWGQSDRMRNVTRKVSEKVSAGRLNMDVDPDILDDPAKGENKTLAVVFSYGGKVDFEEIVETPRIDRLILPKV